MYLQSKYHPESELPWRRFVCSECFLLHLFLHLLILMDGVIFVIFFVKPDTFSGLGVQRVDSDAQAAFL